MSGHLDLNLFYAIIFDFDGVILDSEPIHYEAYNQLLCKMNIHLTYEHYKKNYLGLTDKDIISRLCTDFNLLADIDHNEISEEKSANYNRILRSQSNVIPVNGLEAFINTVLPAKPLAICSGARDCEIRCALQKLQPRIKADHFKHIISADQVKCGKPSPEGYLLTAKRLNLSPSQCLVIEDSPPGISAAKNAGMTVYALLTTHTTSQLQQADYITADFTTLMALISRVQ